MFRMISPARTKSRNGLASAVALAVALAGGSVVATAITSEPAAAQRGPKYSRDFVKVYQPVNELLAGETPDPQAAKAQLPAVIAAIENDDDKNAAGNLTLMIANQINDPALQRQGLELMLASGKVPPEAMGQYQFFVGNLAFGQEDYPAARNAMQAALDAGYTQDNPQGFILESYFAEGNLRAGIDYLTQIDGQMDATGQKLPEAYYLRGLQSALDNDLMAETVELSGLLLNAYPTSDNWQKTLQVVYSLGAYEPTELLDILRLMRETNSMRERREYVTYIEAADPRIMGNEVLAVLADGLGNGIFDSGDLYYREVKSVADARAPADRRDAPSLASEGRSSSTGSAAHSAAEVYLSMGSYAEAEELYALALQKGVEDSNRTLLRLGQTQAHQGKLAEADATFAKVQGKRQPIAQMWKVYVSTKS